MVNASLGSTFELNTSLQHRGVIRRRLYEIGLLGDNGDLEHREVLTRTSWAGQDASR